MPVDSWSAGQCLAYGATNECRRRGGKPNGIHLEPDERADRLNLPTGGLCALPRPAPAHLQLEREAQNCPDRHNHGEHP